jgi:hypothetical protein
MASAEQLHFNAPHSPRQNAIDAFSTILHQIKAEVIKSRHHWNKHEPKMWSRAEGLTDHELVAFSIEADLVQVRSAAASYGTIILGKIKIPAIQDEEGAGYIHVRIHDPPNKGEEDVRFHSLFTEEGNRDADGHPTTWRAIQMISTPLEFFNE